MSGLKVVLKVLQLITLSLVIDGWVIGNRVRKNHFHGTTTTPVVTRVEFYFVLFFGVVQKDGKNVYTTGHSTFDFSHLPVVPSREFVRINRL